jgi:hypothetical protein
VRRAYELLDRELLRLRVAADRFVPLRFEDDDVLLRTGDFFALLFVDVFRVEGFLAVVRAGDLRELLFRADVFLRFDFLAGDFLLGDRFVDDRPLDDGLLDVFFFCRRPRASAVPPIAAPTAATLVAANTGFLATAPAAFLAPDPTFLAPASKADAAPSVVSFIVDIVDPPSCALTSVGDENLRFGGLRPAAFADFSLTVCEISWALSCAICCILSAMTPTTSCAVSVASTLLPACVTDCVSFCRSGIGSSFCDEGGHGLVP